VIHLPVFFYCYSLRCHAIDKQDGARELWKVGAKPPAAGETVGTSLALQIAVKAGPMPADISGIGEI
jgi:hypothetical protein